MLRTSTDPIGAIALLGGLLAVTIFSVMPSRPATATDFHVTSAKTGAMSPCPKGDKNGWPQAQSIVKVIRILFHEDFDFESPTRDVKGYEPVVGGTEADNDGAGNGQDLVNNVNPFDFDLRPVKFPAAVDPQRLYYVEVRIILKDTTTFGFYDNFENDNIHGVGYGDEGNKLDLCGGSLDENAKINPVAVFFVPIRRPGTPNKVRTGAFNFGLQLRKAPQTYIFIDPHIVDSGT